MTQTFSETPGLSRGPTWDLCRTEIPVSEDYRTCPGEIDRITELVLRLIDNRKDRPAPSLSLVYQCRKEIDQHAANHTACGPSWIHRIVQIAVTYTVREYGPNPKFGSLDQMYRYVIEVVGRWFRRTTAYERLKSTPEIGLIYSYESARMSRHVMDDEEADMFWWICHQSILDENANNRLGDLEFARMTRPERRSFPEKAPNGLWVLPEFSGPIMSPAALMFDEMSERLRNNKLFWKPARELRREAETSWTFVREIQELAEESQRLCEYNHDVENPLKNLTKTYKLPRNTKAKFQRIRELKNEVGRRGRRGVWIVLGEYVHFFIEEEEETLVRLQRIIQKQKEDIRNLPRNVVYLWVAQTVQLVGRLKTPFPEFLQRFRLKTREFVSPGPEVYVRGLTFFENYPVTDETWDGAWNQLDIDEVHES